VLTKQDFIDLIPRLAWLLHISLIILVMKIKKEFPVLNSNLYQIIFSIILILLGSYLLLSTGIIVLKYRKKFSPTRIFVEGPYHYIRHPMYLGIYFLLFGIGILFHLVSIFLVSLPLIPIWYGLSKLEENEMTKRFGEQYEKYKKQTGMFFPKINHKRR